MPVKVRVSTRDIYLLCGVVEGLPLFLRLVEVSDSAEEGFGRYVSSPSDESIGDSRSELKGGKTRIRILVM